MFHNSMKVSHIPDYLHIFTWEYRNNRIAKQQKKAMAIINLSKYNVHIEPLFLKIKEM